MSYTRVSILGATFGGEVWSVNPCFDPSGEFGTIVDQAQLDAAAAAIAALSPGTALLGSMSTQMSIVGARVEVRQDSDDKLLAISQSNRGTPLTGSGTNVMPSQCAMVYSLRTNTPGASGRGRIYWPALGVTLNSSGRVANGTLTTNLTAMKAYLLAQRDALAAAFPTIGFNVAVRSKVDHATPHVTRIQVGDVVDTQRRRRDRLAEAYSTLNVP